MAKPERPDHDLLIGVAGPDDRAGSTRLVEQRVGTDDRRWVAALWLVLAAVALVVVWPGPGGDGPGEARPAERPASGPLDTPAPIPTTEPARARVTFTPEPAPVLPEVTGLTVVVHRGIENVFVDLDSGERFVRDLDGAPVAAIGGFVAFDRGSERSWFDLAAREPVEAPDRAVDADTGPGSPAPVDAVSPDGRWIVDWVAGQLFVTELATGVAHEVPGVLRTYYEQSLLLVPTR